MKLNIQIKSILGKVLFEYEKKDNTIKDTLIKAAYTGAYLRGADLTGADLRGADLTGADLRGAYLTGAYLRGAYLTGAYLRGADLTGADLTGAYLTGADLTGAYLRGAYLTGAYLRGAYLTGADLTGAYLTGADLTGAYLTGADNKKYKIEKAAVFTGIYKYICIPFITKKGKKYITLGCYTRKLKDWKKDFWNNTREFPNDGSLDTELRILAFNTAEKWLKLNS